MPWMVAFALRADGWWLRSDVIWAKTRAMPESVKDRPTRSHEYLFLFAKSERYFYDLEATMELASGRSSGKHTPDKTKAEGQFRLRSGFAKIGGVRWSRRRRRDVWQVAPGTYKGAHFAVMPEKLVEPCVLAGSEQGDTVLDPFVGSGTVGSVALRHGRRVVGIDLNPEYVELARQRLQASISSQL